MSEKSIITERIPSFPGNHSIYVTEDAEFLGVALESETDQLEIFILDRFSGIKNPIQISLVQEGMSPGGRLHEYIGYVQVQTYGRMFVFVGDG